ncbi:MAG TPA: FAD:protein FMN transferase [Bryobacteraceae bacterium]|jgi:thiamine biosynthesis lipoprotein
MRNFAAPPALLFAIVPLFGGQPLLHLERSAPAMGTTFSIEMYGSNMSVMQAASEKALAEAKRIDQTLSNYQPGSELSKVNEHAAEAPVKISRELFNLLTACLDYSRASEGAFDITVAPLMKVWGFYKDSGHLPLHSEVAAALAHVGYRNIKLDPAARTVYFARPGVGLDPGGVGKGYAVDKMVGILKENGITCALISGGGSSIYGLGAPPDEPRGWRLSIRDPKDEKKDAAEVYLRDTSLSTSGNYEKFFWAEGKLYSHIMDPRTGFPAIGMLSVSVISPKTLDSEVWAKPYYILGLAWTRQHKPRDFEVLLCEDKPGATCAWVR